MLKGEAQSTELRVTTEAKALGPLTALVLKRWDLSTYLLGGPKSDMGTKKPILSSFASGASV